MRDTGVVTELEQNGLVKIIPVIQDACLSCTVAGCAKRGKPFFVSNPQKLDISVGMHVRVEESKAHQAVQTIINVFLPITLAIITYILLNTQTQASDGAKAGFSLLSLFVSSLALFFISTKQRLVQSEIVEVVE